MLYRLVLSSGLRAHELATLTPCSFTFGDAPTVTVEAKNAKNRKRETLPLLPDVAEAFRAYVGIRPANEPVFGGGSWPSHGGRMLRVDLAAAGIPYRNETGQVVDLHALRHTFVTNLARAGVPPQIAQRLAGHSDVRLTLRVYSHVGLVDLAGALTKLPDLSTSPLKSPAATGIAGAPGLCANLSRSGAVSCGSVTPPDPERTSPQRNENRRRGHSCKRMPPNDDAGDAKRLPRPEWRKPNSHRTGGW